MAPGDRAAHRNDIIGRLADGLGVAKPALIHHGRLGLAGVLQVANKALVWQVDVEGRSAVVAMQLADRQLSRQTPPLCDLDAEIVVEPLEKLERYRGRIETKGDLETDEYDDDQTKTIEQRFQQPHDPPSFLSPPLPSPRRAVLALAKPRRRSLSVCHCDVSATRRPVPRYWLNARCKFLQRPLRIAGVRSERVQKSNKAGRIDWSPKLAREGESIGHTSA